MTIMDVYPDGFNLPNGQIVKFSLEQVATTAANYPHADRVRNVFGLA